MVFIIVYNVEKQLDLNDFALIGRTYEEYRHMFNLDNLIGKKTILDVASGVSSFCAEANKKGYCVTAADQIYNISLKMISQKSEQDLNMVMEQLSDVNDLFVWNYYKNISSLKKYRIKSCTAFLEDFKKYHTTRYVSVKFPETNFKRNQFDISLVSHFLFLYENILDYNFHKMTILELLRITSNQIRIFPIVNLTGKKSRMVDTIMQDDDFKKIHISIKKVDFEFMKNGNEMLVIEK